MILGFDFQCVLVVKSDVFVNLFSCSATFLGFVGMVRMPKHKRRGFYPKLKLSNHVVRVRKSPLRTKKHATLYSSPEIQDENSQNSQQTPKRQQAPPLPPSKPLNPFVPFLPPHLANPNTRPSHPLRPKNWMPEKLSVNSDLKTYRRRRTSSPIRKIPFHFDPTPAQKKRKQIQESLPVMRTIPSLKKEEENSGRTPYDCDDYELEEERVSHGNHYIPCSVFGKKAVPLVVQDYSAKLVLNKPQQKRSTQKKQHQKMSLQRMAPGSPKNGSSDENLSLPERERCEEVEFAEREMKFLDELQRKIEEEFSRKAEDSLNEAHGEMDHGGELVEDKTFDVGEPEELEDPEDSEEEEEEDHSSQSNCPVPFENETISNLKRNSPWNFSTSQCLDLSLPSHLTPPKTSTIASTSILSLKSEAPNTEEDDQRRFGGTSILSLQPTPQFLLNDENEKISGTSALELKTGRLSNFQPLCATTAPLSLESHSCEPHSSQRYASTQPLDLSSSPIEQNSSSPNSQTVSPLPQSPQPENHEGLENKVPRLWSTLPLLLGYPV